MYTISLNKAKNTKILLQYYLYDDIIRKIRFCIFERMMIMKTMMKFLILLALMLSLLTVFAGCGDKIETEVDIDAVIDANSTAALTERFGSFRINLNDADRELYYYADARFVYSHSEAYTDYDGYEIDGYGEIISDDFYGGLEEGKYYTVVYAGMDIDNEWADSLMVNPELLANEEIVSAKEKDGFITLKTELSEAKMIELGYWAEGDFEDCYYITEYKIEKETNVIYEMKEIFVYGTGILNRSTVEYTLVTDVECPAEAEDIYAHITGATEFCKATVVYDPDTAEERSYTVNVPKGDVLYFYWANEEEYVNAYSDRACTKPFAYSAIANADIEIYVTK